MGYSLGVDLGTTFVSAAIASETRIEMVTLGHRSVVTPATVYVREDGTLVTGEAANLRAVSRPDRVSREFKRRLGNPTPVILGGQPYAVTALLGVLLRDVVARVEETEGAPPDHVVLTYPASWGPFRRALFEEVPQHAGLESSSMVTEPEAAAAHYAASRGLADGEIVAVYDLGGGTFDATIVRKLPGGAEILGTPEGIERLGGVDFDEAILSFVNDTVDGALGELDLRDPRITVALARLRQDCILAKEALSVDTETVVPVFLPGRHLDVRVSRSGFESMVRAPIESTIGALSRALQSARIEPSDLSAVLLVGGLSRIPLVARMVSAALGCPTVVDAHPKHAVALGAAELAARLIPAQRAAQYEMVAAPSRGRLVGAARRDTASLEAAAILRTAATLKATVAQPGQPAQPPASSGPLPGNGDARSRDVSVRARTRVAPETTGREMPPGAPAGPSLAAVLLARWRRGWIMVLIVVLVLVLAGIAVVLSLGVNQSPSGLPGPGPFASTEPTLGPEVPIPAIGPTIPVGDSPVLVAVTPNGHHVYIANRDTRVIADRPGACRLSTGSASSGTAG